jgi:hypothetical protein
MPRSPLSPEDQKFIRRHLLVNYAVYLFIGSMAMIFGSNLIFTAQHSGYAQGHSIIFGSAQAKK